MFYKEVIKLLQLSLNLHQTPSFNNHHGEPNSQLFDFTDSTFENNIKQLKLLLSFRTLLECRYAFWLVCLCMVYASVVQSASIPQETSGSPATEKQLKKDRAARYPKMVIDLSFTVDENTPKYPLEYIQPPVTDDFYFKSTVIAEMWWPRTSVWLVVILTRLCNILHFSRPKK